MFIRRFAHHVLLPLLCCFSLANAEIREIMSMEELRDPIENLLKLDKKILVVFDIDDTLVTTHHELGSSEWFYRELAEKQAQPGIDKQQVLKDLLALYAHVHTYLSLKLVEKDTADFITALQYHYVPCLALTARSCLFERIIKQLKQSGINFACCAPSADDLNLSDNPTLPARYTRGIIFNGDNNKGATLLKYLHAIGYTPDYVIYVDDSAKHVQRVHDALEAEGIPCSVFRYGFMDNFNASFDLSKARQQLAVFLKEHPFTQAAA